MFRTLDLNLLRVFNAVMIERNVTQAAAVLFMTQPAVSNAISRLRHSLNDPLFLKVHGGVTATPRAQAIWPPIRDALRQIEQTVGSQEFDPTSRYALFTIAASDYVAEHLIRPIAANLLSSAPFVEVHLKPHRISDAVALLERGEIDFAAGVLSNFNEHIRVAPMDVLEYKGVVRRGHPIGKTPTTEEFLEVRQVAISLSGGPGLIDVELAERGLKRKVALVINHFGLLPRLIAESDLASIIPVKVVQESGYSDQLQLIDLPFPLQSRTVSLLWHERSDHSAEHRWMQDQLLQRSRTGL